MLNNGKLKKALQSGIETNKSFSNLSHCVLFPTAVTKLCFRIFRHFKPLHQNVYSPYCSLYIFFGIDDENLDKNHDLLILLSFP